MKKFTFFSLPVCLLLSVISQGQTTRTASNYTELTAAITASADNDIINITNNIVVSATVALNKTLTLNGNGYYITVPVNGISDAGIQSASPSAFGVFRHGTAGKTITINNLSIKGGNAIGSALNLTGGIARLNNATISNGRYSTSGGGGINNAGATLYLTNCVVKRNSAHHAGGLQIASGSKTYIDKCTFSENRSEDVAGGGGAVENSGTLYINNSTFSNNKSTEIGGAINNVGATGILWVINSTFSGNIGYGTTTAGGAIGVNASTANIINCLFAYNYVRSAGTVTSPTNFALDDVSKFNGTGTIRSYYNIFQGSSTAHNTTVSNVAYTGNVNGSDNTVFSNGIYTTITNGLGNVIGTGKIFQPFLVNSTGGQTATLQPGSFVLIAGNRGTKTGYSNTTVPETVGYFNGASWVTLQGINPQNFEVITDQLGATRSNPTARGSVEAVVPANIYMLKVNTSPFGSVSGASLYGDVYASGTILTVTAVAASGQQFVRWDYVEGGTGVASTNNPYTLTLTQNTTLVPVFTTAAAGNFTITYLGNGNTSGTVPAPQTTNTPTTIASKGNMSKTGYLFTNWNTSNNGSGTNYSEGQAYSSGANLTLFAQWVAQAALPVTLVGFNVTQQGKDALLTWSTASEQNSDHFEIESSNTGSGFIKIGEVTATGNSNSIVNYNFTDRSISRYNSKRVYYRLKLVDLDGKYKYSDIKFLTLAKTSFVVKTYPVPFSNRLTIELPSGWNGSTTIKIIDMNGRIVYQRGEDISSTQTNLVLSDLSTLPHGSYILSLLNDKNEMRIQLVKE